MRIWVSSSVLTKFEGICLAYCTVENTQVHEPTPPKLDKFLANVEENIRKSYHIETLKDNPVIRAYRDFYWRIGIDPTKQRPSSEALIRRVLRGKRVPRINSVVDTGNIASMETLIPIGLYDIDNIVGEPVLRWARRGEVFKPIGGREEELSENQIVLADKEKILHVFPHRDSTLTMITRNTRNVLVVACGVPAVSQQLVQEAARLAAMYIVEFSGGEASEVRIAEVLEGE